MFRASVLVVLAVSWAGVGGAVVPPFFAAAQPSGSMVVTLHPTEGVAPGVPQLVTFGLPFTRGSITAAGLATVRVLDGANEVPAHVAELTPWRHLSNAAVDGQSTRVALVQIHHSFATEFPGSETVTVEWGITPRALDVPTLESPRSGWHLVNDAEFLDADGVSEPDVYAVLPAAVLAKGVLELRRLEPFPASVPVEREDPAAMDAVSDWPGYEEEAHAIKNSFYSVINQDDPLVQPANQCDYRNQDPDTQGEPWLYDRASTMFSLYLRSASFPALRSAVRNAGFYANHLDAEGFVDFKDYQDSKYSYAQCLAAAYWLTGDPVAAAEIPSVVNAHSTVATRWSPSLGFWTERHVAFKLLANVVAFEVQGDAATRATVEEVLADLLWLQDGADGQLPAGRVDGGLYHYGWQHDWDWDESSFGASPWMAVLVADAVVRAYGVSEDPALASFLTRLAAFQRAAVVASDENDFDAGPLATPMYAMLWDGSVGQLDWGDVEHALDVASSVAWGAYFADLVGPPSPTLLATVDELYETFSIGVNHWIRPTAPSSGLTAYRVSPWRKWSWQHRVSASLSWIMKPASPVIFEDGFESASATAWSGQVSHPDGR